MPEPIKEDTLMGEILEEWTIQEYEKHERSRLWFILIGIAGLFLVFYGVKTGNFLFSLIVILFSIILFLQHHQEPKQLSFQITDLGVVVGSRFYSYGELESFYVVYNPNEAKTLFLDTKATFQPRLRIPLLDMNPVEAKSILREFLPENIEKEEEPMSDRVARNWKLH